MKKLLCVVAVVVGIACIPHITLGAAPFYEGKTIRIVVGVSAGGGFDLYARILSRHMTRYIPGKPTIIVENVTGGRQGLGGGDGEDALSLGGEGADIRVEGRGGD